MTPRWLPLPPSRPRQGGRELRASCGGRARAQPGGRNCSLPGAPARGCSLPRGRGPGAGAVPGVVPGGRRDARSDDQTRGRAPGQPKANRGSWPRCCRPPSASPRGLPSRGRLLLGALPWLPLAPVSPPQESPLAAPAADGPLSGRRVRTLSSAVTGPVAPAAAPCSSCTGSLLHLPADSEPRAPSCPLAPGGGQPAQPLGLLPGMPLWPARRPCPPLAHAAEPADP